MPVVDRCAERLGEIRARRRDLHRQPELVFDVERTADMDALPITEATGVDDASAHPGGMHAGGHDGHTAMLLGAAVHLAETRNFDGTVVVVFQPAEEGGGGGREMVEEGLMDRFGVHEIDGMPNQPGLPVGRFAIESGALLAAADEFTVEIEGHGGHAAHPQYDFDDVAIPVGCSFRVRLAETALPLRRGGAVKW